MDRTLPCGNWQIVWVAFTIAAFGWGIGFYGPSVYLPTLHLTRGWPISTISLAITAHYIFSAILIVWLPEVYRRVGVRKITFAGAILGGLGAVMWANVREPWQLVPAFVVSGAGWAATSGAALNAIVAPWFDESRPKAMSMAFNGASVGGLLFTPLWAGLISTLGLTKAALIIGIAMPAVLCPLALRFISEVPRSAPNAKRHDQPNPRSQLFRQPSFVTISIGFALGLFAQIGLFSHMIARLEPDFGSSLAVLAISVITLCAVFGRSTLGWMFVDYDRRILGAASILMQAVGSLLLALGSGVPALSIGCILFGLGVGNLTSLPPLIAQQEFRPVDVANVVSLIIAINQAVYAFAPAIFGWLHDLTASYVAPFIVAAAVQSAAAGILALGHRFR